MATEGTVGPRFVPRTCLRGFPIGTRILVPGGNSVSLWFVKGVGPDDSWTARSYLSKVVDVDGLDSIGVNTRFLRTSSFGSRSRTRLHVRPDMVTWPSMRPI
jgi:hypothetical protein